jgi:hypothetical protein
MSEKQGYEFPRTLPPRTHLDLLRCYYNFLTPHRALKFVARRGDHDASWADHPAADLKGDLPVDDGSLGIKEGRIRTINQLGHVNESPMPVAA